jgi:methionyl-tRNA formyltransferase
VRILFAGSAAIAVPTLQAVARHHEVAAVLTNTDKPGPRGRTLVPTPVKEAAVALGLDVLQFDRLGKDARDAVAPYGCDTLLCFAYGRIFGPKFLALFEGEKLNIHPSLLPALRGPSPIQGAILAQLPHSGISIQRIGLEMDSGDILSAAPFDLLGDETTLTLTDRVSELSAPLALEALERIKEGRARFTAQSGEPTYTTLIEPAMAELDFTKSARSLHAQIRAMNPWPKAQTTFDGQRLFITAVHGTLSEAGAEKRDPSVAVGTVVAKDRKRGVGIAVSDGILWVTALQLEKRKELDALSFLNGNQHLLGSILG